MNSREHISALTKRAAAGDGDAVRELVAHYAPGLHAFVRLRLGQGLRGRESSSDIAQSACREVLEKADDFRFDGEDAFRRWLYTEARRKIADKHAFHRAGVRDVDRELPNEDVDNDNERLQRVYAQLCTPSQHAIARERMAAFERAFATLPEDYREVILLSRVLGLSSEDVASEMDRSVSSVRNLLYRAMNRLAAEVED